MNCPKCNIQLIEKSYGKILFDLCNNCEGIWFDTKELFLFRKQIANNEELTEYYWEFSEEKTSDGLECPRCVTLTLKFGELHGYKLHRCSECSGFFLNKDTVIEITNSERSLSSKRGDSVKLAAQQIGIEVIGGVVEFILGCIVWGE